MRDLASDDDLETLYTVARFVAAREDRRTTHPLLRDTRGLSLPGGDAAGLLMISGESVATLLLLPGSCGLPPRTPPTGQFTGTVEDSTETALGRLFPTDNARDFLTDPPARR